MTRVDYLLLEYFRYVKFSLGMGTDKILLIPMPLSILLMPDSLSIPDQFSVWKKVGRHRFSV